jgi:hypothetical protein
MDETMSKLSRRALSGHRHNWPDITQRAAAEIRRVMDDLPASRHREDNRPCIGWMVGSSNALDLVPTPVLECMRKRRCRPTIPSTPAG